MQSTVENVRVRVLPDGRLSRRDAAAWLGYEPQTLANWVQEKRGPPAIRVGGRVFYRLADLQAFAGVEAA